MARATPGRWLAALALALFGAAALASCQAPQKAFGGARAIEHVKAQLAFGPRPVGSAAGARTAQYIAGVLKGYGWEVEVQEFEHLGLKGRNVIGKKGKGPLTIIGTHYDTRPIADRDPANRTAPVPGANDGASGTAVLLELARTLAPAATREKQVWLAFFDAEDRGGLGGWSWSEGARQLAESFVADAAIPKPEAVVIVDMVGDHDQAFYYEFNSVLALQEEIWELAAQRGYGAHFIPQHRHTVYDDQVPFVQRGMRAALIIDLDYAPWHTQQDTLDKISADSLQRVGDVLETWLERTPAEGK